MLSLQNKEDAEDEYEQSVVNVNNAIQNAWNYYYEQTETIASRNLLR